MATEHSYIVGELRSWAAWGHRGNAPVELAVLLDEAAAALAAPPVEQQAEPCQICNGRGFIGHADAEVRMRNDGKWGRCLICRPYESTLPTEQPAPRTGAAEFDSLPAILGDLRHSTRVDGYTEDQRGFMEAIAVRLETRINALSGPLRAPVAHPTAQPSQAEEESFVGYLCRAWGESDLPVAEIVRDLESVGRFMVNHWLGGEDAQDYDGTPTLPRLMTEWQGHDWGDMWSAEFEIGGVSVERLHCTIPAARAAQAQGEKGKA